MMVESEPPKLHLTPLQSYQTAARMIFASFLRNHKKSHLWHYAVHLSERNENSLSWYLGVNLEELEEFLLLIGLAKIDNYHKRIVCDVQGWNTFLIEEKLDDAVKYFDKMQIRNVPGASSNG